MKGWIRLLSEMRQCHNILLLFRCLSTSAHISSKEKKDEPTVKLYLSLKLNEDTYLYGIHANIEKAINYET